MVNTVVLQPPLPKRGHNPLRDFDAPAYPIQDRYLGLSSAILDCITPERSILEAP